MPQESPFIEMGTTTAATRFADHVGTEVETNDYNVTSSPATLRTNHKKRLRLVQNVSTVALTAKQAVTYTAGSKQTTVDGYGLTPGGPIAGLVDEWLASAGVPVSSYFWITVDGPSLAVTGQVGDTTNVITEGNPVYALTAGASTASTTAGRVGSPVFQATSQATDFSALLNNANNAVGRALSAKTTANTAADLLVMVKTRFK